MRRLVIDLARRSPRRSAFFVAMLLLMSWLARVGGEPRMAFGASMGVAFAVGPLAVWLMPRAIWYLPVSGREVWRANWLVATVGATLLTTTAKLVAFALPATRPYGFASLVLSTVYDFAYAGIGCGLLIVATRPRPAGSPWGQMWPIAKGLAEFTLPLGLLAAFLGVTYSAVPTHWVDLTARSWTILAVALVVTIATYFHAPSPPPRVPEGSFMFRSALTPPATPRGGVAASARRSLAGRFSGLPRLLIHEYLWTLLVGAGLATASALVVLVGAGVWRSPEFAVELLRSQRLLFGPRATSPQPLGFAALALLIWYAFFVASLAARFPSMLRHLRVLPLSAAQVNTLLVAWPTAAWVTVWVSVVAAQYAVAGRESAALQVDLFVALTGFSALVQALALRLGTAARVFAFGVAAGLVPLVYLLGRPSPSTLAAVGIGCLAAAAALNHVALRRSATYKQIGPTVGPGVLTTS